MAQTESQARGTRRFYRKQSQPAPESPTMLECDFTSKSCVAYNTVQNLSAWVSRMNGLMRDGGKPNLLLFDLTLLCY